MPKPEASEKRKIPASGSFISFTQVRDGSSRQRTGGVFCSEVAQGFLYRTLTNESPLFVAWDCCEAFEVVPEKSMVGNRWRG